MKDFGEVLYVMIMDEFDAVVDKCQVTLVTDKAKAKRILEEEALPTYDARDDRLASMTDESVDRFYTCILCQSFAPGLPILFKGAARRWPDPHFRHGVSFCFEYG